MEFEFDKEMDALLRQAAQNETVSENSKFKIQNSKLPHLDADEISAFAENALPEKTKLRIITHFADCDRCRKILSDLIPLNSENEIISVKETKKNAAPTILWYQKLFAFPNIAYTMGALVLVFSGLVAFILLQGVDKSQNTEVSQIDEKSHKGGGPFSDEDAAIVEEKNSNMMSSNSMANASMSNSATAASSNAMMSNASTHFNARTEAQNFNSNLSIVLNKSSVSANKTPKDEPRIENEITRKAVTELPLQGRIEKNLAEQKQERDKKENKKDAETTDAIKLPAPQPKSEQSAVSENQMMSDAPSAKAKKNLRTANVEIINAGGKTFRRTGNVWIDSAYKNQATTSITRDTKEYKKLDSSLRGIAENLGGTVIVVWKEKAYRIQ